MKLHYSSTNNGDMIEVNVTNTVVDIYHGDVKVGNYHFTEEYISSFI